MYKHINNTDVAFEVTKFTRIPGKDYAKIKGRWVNVIAKVPYVITNREEYLTDAGRPGNRRERQKYPLDKWEKEWIRFQKTK